MKVKIEPARLEGEVKAVSSKSIAHRSLICAALSNGPTTLCLPDRSADILATIDCLSAMGAEIRLEQELCRVRPLKRGSVAQINCRESGSTLRFLLPVAAAVCESARFTGEGRLPQRPVEQLITVLKEHGTTITQPEHTMAGLPLHVKGRPESGVYRIEGNISSQYISGLLFALPLLSGESCIRVTTPMESSSYVNMTIATLEEYGVCVKREGNGFQVSGGQTYRTKGRMNVEGDWSNAAFFLASGAVGGSLTCTGLNTDSGQGDKAILEILSQMGAKVSVERRSRAEGGDRITVSPGRLSGMEIDVSQIPDLMPVLAITACCGTGKTLFQNAGRLRMKESDRLKSTAALIHALGGRAEEGNDSLTVYGTEGLAGGEVSSFGDHRIVMAAAVAAQVCREPVIIGGAEAVEKSYPGFFRDYNSLGGRGDVI